MCKTADTIWCEIYTISFYTAQLVLLFSEFKVGWSGVLDGGFKKKIGEQTARIF